MLSAEYVAAYVELAYASTAHGVQGDTVITAHVVLGERTGTASAHVGTTRGRRSNNAQLVAEDLTEARKEWRVVFARDRQTSALPVPPRSPPWRRPATPSLDLSNMCQETKAEPAAFDLLRRTTLP